MPILGQPMIKKLDLSFRSFDGILWTIHGEDLVNVFCECTFWETGKFLTHCGKYAIANDGEARGCAFEQFDLPTIVRLLNIWDRFERLAEIYSTNWEKTGKSIEERPETLDEYIAQELS